MNNHLVADNGDFYKYALLRAIIGDHHHEPRLRLGVIWYFTVGTSDTRPCFDFVDDPGHVALDDELRDILKKMHNLNVRTIAEIERREVFPKDALFFAEVVPGKGEDRDDWFSSASKRVKAAEVVFLDPDTGLRPRRSARMTKSHCDYSELAALWLRGQTVALYQHNNREGAVKHQLARRVEELRRELPGAVIEYVYFHKGQCTLYVAMQPNHTSVLQTRLTAFRLRWAAHVKCSPQLNPGSLESDFSQLDERSIIPQNSPLASCV